MSLLRPNTAIVDRQQTAGTSNTGTPVPAPPRTIYAGLPCIIDAISALRSFELDQARGSEPVIIGGHMLVADGANIHGTPGTVLTFNGVKMVIAPNGRAAFPDVREGDRITGEDGLQYLALGVHHYSDVFPNIQVQLQLGKAWGGVAVPETGEINVQLLTQGDLNIGAGSLIVESGADLIAGPCTDWTIELTGGAGLTIKNNGKVTLGGAYPSLQGVTSPESVCTVDGGTFTIGRSSGDGPSFYFGGSAIGAVNIEGDIELLGQAELSVGNAANGQLNVPLGCALLFSEASEAFVSIAGVLTINGSVAIVDDNAITSAHGAALAMFTHGISGLELECADASYSDGSQGPITGWAWDFGDGGTSTAQNPSHGYASAGTYTVTLTVTTFAGVTSICTVPVTVT